MRPRLGPDFELVVLGSVAATSELEGQAGLAGPWGRGWIGRATYGAGVETAVERVEEMPATELADEESEEVAGVVVVAVAVAVATGDLMIGPNGVAVLTGDGMVESVLESSLPGGLVVRRVGSEMLTPSPKAIAFTMVEEQRGVTVPYALYFCSSGDISCARLIAGCASSRMSTQRVGGYAAGARMEVRRR